MNETSSFNLSFPDPGEPDSGHSHEDSLQAVESVKAEPKDQALEDITLKLKALEAKIETWEATQIKPHRDKISDLAETADQMYQDYLKAKKATDEALFAEKNAMYQANQDLAKLKFELNSLSADKMATLAAVAAQEKMAELSGKLEEIIKTLPWWDRLFEFQREDVQFMAGAFEAGSSGVLLANEMSMGKNYYRLS